MGRGQGSSRSNKGGGGGKGKSISGGGASSQATTSAPTSQFTPEEQTGIDNTVAKLRQVPQAEQQKQIARAEASTNDRIKETYNAVQKLENTMKQYEERNPGRSRTNHPLYNDYTKAQSRYESARKDRAKIEEVKKKLS